MTYEPDQRYSTDRGSRQEIDKAFSEKPGSGRGQFWNVDNHIRGRWIGAGASLGFTIAIFSVLDWSRGIVYDGYFGPFWVYLVACAVLGGVIGFVAASVRRRFTGED